MNTFFKAKKILGKNLLFKQIQKFAIYIVVMFALCKPLVIFYFVEFLFALFLCLLEFLKEIWLCTVHCPLETQLQEGMLITMYTKTTDSHLVNLAYERRLNSNVINRVCHSAGLLDKFDSCRVG